MYSSEIWSSTNVGTHDGYAVGVCKQGLGLFFHTDVVQYTQHNVAVIVALWKQQQQGVGSTLKSSHLMIQFAEKILCRFKWLTSS